MLTVTENQPALLVSFQRSGVPSARNGAIFSAFMADEVSAKPETAQEGGAGPQGPLPRDNRDEPASDPAMGAGLPAHREEPDNDLLAGAVMGPRQGQEPRPGPQPVTVSGHERAADAPGPQARDLTEPPAAATTPPRGAQLTDARVTSLSPTWTNADPDTRAPLGRLPLPGIATVREGPQNAPASPRAASPAPPGTTLLHGAGTTIERALGLARHADSREAPGRGGSPTAPLATQPGLAWISGHRTNADMAGDARIDTVAPADITPDARTDPAAPGPAPVALQSAALTQAAQMPQHAMAQVAAALIRTMADGRKSTELRLDPEELGQVRMRLSVIDGALTVTLLADRGETLELMRRNIDLLSRDLHQSGYDNARFVFPQGDTERNDRHQAESSRAPAPLVNATDLPDMPGSVLVTLDDRLDIRL